MFRRSFRSWLIPLLLGPTCALALEIGEIQINSALNQLFDARIPLPNLTPEELAKVSVKLAPPPMFKEFGLDRARTLGKLVFSIEYNAEGEVYVRVVSTEPIREPSLGLLLEFGWPRGKTYREFTVFLDPVQRLAKQPGDRTKTVLDTPTATVAGPAAASSPPTSELPPAGTVASKLESGSEPLPKPEPTVAVTAPASTAGPVEPPPLPVETPPLPVERPATVKTYKPGDSYGPVAPGEGLWAIALKLRPDGITREEMMQALFRANPQAFSKAGIEGLKIGSTLRIPTWREIADFTGSKVAGQLAETEQASLPVAAEPTGVTAARAGGSGPEVFALPPPGVFEPTPIGVTPAVAGPESASSVFEPGVRPVTAVPVAPTILEPISATPLLFLAVSEVIASAAQVPVLATVAQIAPRSSVPAAPLSELAPQAPDTAAIPLAVTPKPVADSARAPGEVATDVRGPVMLKPPGVGMDAIEWLAALERRIPPVMLDLTSPSLRSDAASAPLPVMELDRAPPPTTENGGESEPLSAEMPADTATPPVVETPSETAAPPVVQTPSEATEAAGSDTAKSPAVQTDGPSTPDSVEPAASTYKGGAQYGPVAANERLWDIAAKVRPDPAIGKDVMMKALFKANPQAFFKARIDQMKEGALLRIPTLREIVEYTGSKAAKELLEQQQTVEAPAPEPAVSAPAPAAETAPAPVAGPAPEPTAASETPPVPKSTAPSPPTAEIPPAPSPKPAVDSSPALEPVAPTTETPAITDSPLPAAAGGKEVSK